MKQSFVFHTPYVETISTERKIIQKIIYTKDYTKKRNHKKKETTINDGCFQIIIWLHIYIM